MRKLLLLPLLLLLFLVPEAKAGKWASQYCTTANPQASATTTAPVGALSTNSATKSCLSRTDYPLSGYASGVQQSGGGITNGNSRAQTWQTFDKDLTAAYPWIGGWTTSFSSPSVFIRPGAGTNICAWITLTNLPESVQSRDLSCVTTSSRGGWWSGGPTGGGEGTYSLSIPDSVLNNRSDGLFVSSVSIGLRCSNAPNCALTDKPQMVYWKNISTVTSETLAPLVSLTDAGASGAVPTSGTSPCPVGGSSCGNAVVSVSSADAGGGMSNVQMQVYSSGDWRELTPSATSSGYLRPAPAPSLLTPTDCSAAVAPTTVSLCAKNYNPEVTFSLSENNGFDLNGENKVRFCSWDMDYSNSFYSAGIKTCTNPRTFTLRNTLPPAPIITEEPSPISADPDPHFAWIGEEGGSFQCDLREEGEGHSWSACSSPRSYDTLPDGSYTFFVRQLDPWGRAGPETSYSFQIDTTPMTASWDSAPPSPTNANVLQYTLSFSENVTGIRSSDFINLGSASGCSFSTNTGSGSSAQITAVGCGEGSVIATLRAESVQYPRGLGPDSDTSASEVIINRTPPPAPIITGPQGITGNASPIWSWSGEEGGFFQCSLDDSAWEECISPRAYSDLADGIHLFAVRQVDAAGNTGPAGEKEIEIDTTPPQAEWSDTPASPTNSEDLQYTLQFSSPVGGISPDDFALAGTATDCAVSVSTPEGSSALVTLSGCSEGTVALTLQADSVQRLATGISGPASDLPAPEVTIDRTIPPAPVITSGPDGRTTERSPLFAWTGVAGGTFECKVQGSGTEAPWIPCSSPSASSLLNNGPYTFYVREKDPAGNTGPASSRAFEIEAPIPLLSWTALTPSPTASKELIFRMNWSEPISGLQSGDMVQVGTATGCILTPAATSGSTIEVRATGCSLGSVQIKLLANSVQGASEPGPGVATLSEVVARACPMPILQVKKATLGKLLVRSGAGGCSVTLSGSYGKKKLSSKRVSPASAGTYRLQYSAGMRKALKQALRRGKKPRISIRARSQDGKQKAIKVRIRK